MGKSPEAGAGVEDVVPNIDADVYGRRPGGEAEIRQEVAVVKARHSVESLVEQVTFVLYV